ncbi:MAG: class I SAM-dependent methyltransferase [Rhodospirillaceae bacterium]|jgi:predicted O-methyltransferase YrrM|nr:class I SAM-dependent methyltransferase [Rhodospirillaceae bacterium]MBT5459376.1 class I SAM-dependent methyltransferase [Rhodospirillaceae bacterium]
MTAKTPAPIAELYDLIAAADAEGPVPHPGDKALSGLSGRKTVGLLQRLAAARASIPERCYVEIGVFQGLTLLSVALAAPEANCFGIDDFSILDPEEKNLAIVKNRIRDLGATNARLINSDYEVALASLPEHVGNRRLGVCFIDGAHDYRSQLMGLLLALPHLADDGVLVVDDANYAFVRRATSDFLVTHPDFRLIFEAYSPAHPANMDRSELAQWEAGWLNGIHVIARDPAHALPHRLPPLADDRALYVNDWLVHRHGLAALAPEALEIASAIVAADQGAETAARQSLLQRHAECKAELEALFPDRNTRSAGLTEGHVNRS